MTVSKDEFARRMADLPSNRARRIKTALRSDLTCHGIVTRDGEQDACGKPATTLIDGEFEGNRYVWPACPYHAHRYGRGNSVPLADILRAVRDG